jgi:hypothetical protein
MRGGWSGLGLFAIAAVSVVACTFIVDGEFKDFSGTCQISGIGDNVCGRCIAQNCQSNINGLCTNDSVTSSVTTCVQNPAPGRNWNCASLMSPSTLDASVSADINDLNHCTAGCLDKCLTCTTIDAGTGACGTCIMRNCGPLLNGLDGCCDNTTVSEGIAKAVGTTNPSCSPFRVIYNEAADSGVDGATPVFTSCKSSGAQEFAKCVVEGCPSQCSCQ